MARSGSLSPRARRERIRHAFDASVAKEWNRHGGEPWRILRRTLRERFLRRHLARVGGTLLELGPGPGRFTPVLRARPRRSVVAVDISREPLLAAARRAARARDLAPVHWIQGMGERLPLKAGSVEGVVALGNIVSFASVDALQLLTEIARVTQPGGQLIADFPTAVGALQEFFHDAARERLLRRVLRRPRFYLIDQALADGFLPYAPHRLGRWEFQFYTVDTAKRLLRHAGLDVTDAMSVGPIARMDEQVISVARRDTRAWESLLRIEERTGRRPGVREAGDGFLVCAERRDR